MATGMLWQQIFQARVESLVATARVVLAAAALFAVWLDPSQPSRYPQAGYTLLVVYMAYALVVVGWVMPQRHTGPKAALFRHTVDILVFTCLMYLTEGPNGPFFLLFSFSLVAAMLKWQRRGVLWTAGIVIAAFAVLGLVETRIIAVADFETNRFVIRITYLFVIGAMLAYVASHHERVWTELMRLAQGAVRAGASDAPLRDALEQACGVFGAPRAVLLWTEPDEPWLYMASWDTGRYREERRPPSTYDPPVLEPFAASSLLCRDAAAPTEVLVRPPDGPAQPWRGQPVHPRLQEDFDMRETLSLPLASTSYEGRLFVMGGRGFSADDLVVGRIVAGQIAAAFDRIDLNQELQRSGALQERMRLARDLHDGTLQTLAATALQLSAVEQVVLQDPEAAQRRIVALQRSLEHEQRDLRAFINRMRPQQPVETEPGLDLRGEIAALVETLRHYWNVDIVWSLEPGRGRAPAGLIDDVHRLIREAVSNAVRHGGAGRIEIEAGIGSDGFRLRIRDDGKGLPAYGSFDQDTLAMTQLGPASLRERVAALGGNIRVDSSPEGVDIHIRIPVSHD